MAADHTSSGVDTKIIRQILTDYIKCEQAVLNSGAYSIEQEQEARDKIRQASTLRLCLRNRSILKLSS